MLYLAEHFYSIQGEGKYSGSPSIFLRFGGCNLQCEGFKVSYKIDGEERFGCDSFYAVDRGFSSNWRAINEIDEITKILSSYPDFVKDIVITGGEPLIYAKDLLFLSILRVLKERDFRITIETNGTIQIEQRDEFKDTVFAIALKLSNSGEEFGKRFILDAIQSIISNSKDSFFKFSVDKLHIDKGLSYEIQKIGRFFPESDIYCMPIAKNREELEENSEAVIKLCLKEGYKYSDRLQIRIWNDKKGC
jgi:7-carboxy-7-deazaguanine synthase